MNHCAIQQNSFATRDEIWGSASAAAAGRSVDTKETVVCPKPRRLGLIHSTLYEPAAMRSLRWHVSYQQEICDAKVGNELMDIIQAKGGCGADQSAARLASSPPFFTGSPPSRVSNPLIQDARFRDDKITQLSPRAFPVPTGHPPSPNSARKGGCVRSNFGNNPAVRVEGFDCLDRDNRRNRSIPTLA